MQKNHWPKHKKVCKRRAAELCDEALFKDPPAKEECPICFLPMSTKLISCISHFYPQLSSVPIKDFAIANFELKVLDMADTTNAAERPSHTHMGTPPPGYHEE